MKVKEKNKLSASVSANVIYTLHRLRLKSTSQVALRTHMDPPTTKQFRYTLRQLMHIKTHLPRAEQNTRTSHLITSQKLGSQMLLFLQRPVATLKDFPASNPAARALSLSL